MIICIVYEYKKNTGHSTRAILRATQSHYVCLGYNITHGAYRTLTGALNHFTAKYD